MATISVVSCKVHQAHRRINAPPRRYKDTKNKRGIGDYPFNFQQGGSTGTPSYPSYGQDVTSFGSFGSIGGGTPFGLSHGLIHPPGFPTLSSNLGSLGSYGQSLNLAPGSNYNLPTSDLATLSSGLNILTSEKNGPAMISASQSPSSSGHQQSYTPLYASSAPIGTNSFTSPMTMGSSQIAANQFQSYGNIPSSGLNHGFSLNSLMSGSGLNYGAPSPDSTSGYQISGPIAQPSGPSASYSFPVSALTSASSSPQFVVSIPPSSSYSLASNNPSGSSNNNNNGSPFNVQLPLTSSSSVSPQIVPLSSPNSPAGIFGKYASTYTNDPQRGSGTMTKLTRNANPGRHSSSNGNNYQTPNYNSASYDANKQSSIPLTSYGTPAMPYFNYGSSSTSSNSGSISNNNGGSNYFSGMRYNSQQQSTSNPLASSYTSSLMDFQAPILRYTASPISSHHGTSSSSSSNSISYQADPNYKNSGNSYRFSSSPLPSYHGTSGSSSDENTIFNYRNPDPALNSIESGEDASTAYTNQSPRYLNKYVSREVNDFQGSSSSSNSYDTISYSAPSGKY